jgi:uncharacterized membrane protein YidH (DUF202 family)
MNKRTVMIGVVILLIGIALIIGGAIGALGSITISTTFTQPHPGEYLSAEIVLNTTSNLAVASPVASGGIVSAQNLTLVTSTNINTYAVPYSASAAGTDVYKSLSGDYYYVAFGSAQPDTKIVATPQGSRVLLFAALILLGVVLAIVGVVVAVVGAVRKTRPHMAGQDPSP